MLTHLGGHNQNFPSSFPRGPRPRPGHPLDFHGQDGLGHLFEVFWWHWAPDLNPGTSARKGFGPMIFEKENIPKCDSEKWGKYGTPAISGKSRLFQKPKDHKPEDPDERLRIEAQGGIVARQRVSLGGNEDFGPFGERFVDWTSHTVHVWYLYPLLVDFMVHVGNYTVHGWYGWWIVSVFNGNVWWSFFLHMFFQKRWHDALLGLVQRHALVSAVSMFFAEHELDVEHRSFDLSQQSNVNLLSRTLSTSTLRCFFFFFRGRPKTVALISLKQKDVY